MPKPLPLLLALTLLSTITHAEDIHQLPSADNSTLPYLLNAEVPNPTAPVPAVAILFNGGEGNVGLMSKGIPKPGANFLVRSRSLFVAHGIPVAVIDVPSDMRGMSDSYRMGKRHAGDVAALAEVLRQQFPAAKLFLVGTSRGTVSAAYAGEALGSKLAGVVLTSSVFNASRDNNGLSGFAFDCIKVPLLFVHHVDDGCAASPYYPAKKLAASYPLISVHGGKPATSGPCEPFAPHGYLGMEEATVDAIANWMLGKPYPQDIN
ncbi:alpha/beta hydrolase [Chitinimonas naiadis]